jgi:16S rRNA (uracil1498-N3)-methyltransferase
MDELYKLPRLYTDAELMRDIELCDEHAHYLRHVLRREDGETVRFFNGRDGEVLAVLAFNGKRGVTAKMQNQVKTQPVRKRRVHLLFPLIKKDRLDTLIECAVQLDATDLHPILTDRTEVRELKQDRMHMQIIEAAEQSERMDLPLLHPLQKLDKILAVWKDIPVFAGLERSDAQLLNDALVPDGDVAALIGPVGGWTDSERSYLNETPDVIPVSLGPNVLRCEIAAASLLTRLARP